MAALRVLELYAGIGGMHCALKRCFAFSGNVATEDDANVFPYSSYEVVAAVDVNEVAAAVYRHNFPAVHYLRKGVEGFSLADLEVLRFDMVTMSPPCQPFTRQGLRKDEEDARTKSFFHFLSLLETMAERGTAPSYVLVENVFGFETSSTHRTLVETLRNCGFRWREFLLTPTQFGVPNSRLRYYLIGKIENRGSGERTAENASLGKFCFQPSTDRTLIEEPLPEATPFRYYKTGGVVENTHIISNSPEPAQKRLRRDGEPAESELGGESAVCVDPISYFLDELDDVEEKIFLVPDKVLKRFMVMDVTYPDSRRSCCFTKAYGHYVDGTGSFLQLSREGATRDSVYEEIKRSRSDAAAAEAEKRGVEAESGEKAVVKPDSLTETDMSLLRNLRLRYFTPSEIARLHCLSSDFGFPDSVSRKQRWKVLGNGLNAHVVAVLMRLLLTPGHH